MKRVFALLLAICMLLPAAIITHANTDNLALGKPTSSSGTMEAYSEANVNDGDPNTIWVRGGLLAGAYIQVDLGDTYTITSVILKNRLDGKDEPDAHIYRTKVDLWFSNDPEFKTYDVAHAMTEVDPGYGVPIEVSAPSRKGYRYVRAVKTDTIIFVLAEMEVYGYLSTGEEATGAYGDVIGTKYEPAVTLLQNIGAASPVSEDAYGVNNLMNRAEAVSSVKRVFSPGFDYETTTPMPFSDVSTAHPFYHEIYAGHKLGYTIGNGDGTFTPDRFVTQQEFATMVLRGLGYEQKLAGHANYAAGIAALSRELALFKNVASRADGLLSHGDATMILYNALLASRMNIHGMQEDFLLFELSDDTALEELYGITLYQGIVTENRKYRLSGAVKEMNNSAVVGSLGLNDAGGQLDAFLGKHVIVGMHEDDPERIVMAWESDRNETVTLGAKTLITTEADVAAGRITALLSDGNTERYDFSDTADVIYNGAPYPGFTPADLLIDVGSITLLDNDRDRVYDVLYVDTYEADFVLGAYSDGDIFSFVDGDGTSHSFNSEYLTIISSDGLPNTTSGVRNGRVVAVYRAKSGDEGKIVIFTRSSVSGQVTGISDDGITIDETAYTYASKALVQDFEIPKMKESVALFLDVNGDIVWIQPDDGSTNMDWLLGFSQKINLQEQGLSHTLQFRIFTEEGNFVDYTVAESLELEGSKADREDFADRLKSSTDGYKGSLLRYKLNGDNLITAIDSVNAGGAEDPETTFHYEGHLPAAMFVSGSSAFWSGHEMVTMAQASTPVFLIPYVEGVFNDSDSLQPLYAISTVRDVAGENSNDDHNLDEYMRDEYGYPICFLRGTTGVLSSGSGGTVQVVNQESAPYFLVQGISSVSIDGETGIKIEGINLSANKEDSFIAERDLTIIESGLIFQDKAGNTDWYNPREQNRMKLPAIMSSSAEEQDKYLSSISDVKFGDILRYQMLGDLAFAVERAFNYNPGATPPTQSGSVWLSAEGSYPDFYSAFNRFQLAKVTGVSEKTLNFEVETATKTVKETYAREAFNNIYYCDAATRRLVKKAEGDLFAYMHEGSRLMLYNLYTDPTAIVIYEYN